MDCFHQMIGLLDFWFLYWFLVCWSCRGHTDCGWWTKWPTMCTCTGSLLVDSALFTLCTRLHLLLVSRNFFPLLSPDSFLSLSQQPTMRSSWMWKDGLLLLMLFARNTMKFVTQAEDRWEEKYTCKLIIGRGGTNRTMWNSFERRRVAPIGALTQIHHPCSLQWLGIWTWLWLKLKLTKLKKRLWQSYISARKITTFNIDLCCAPIALKALMSHSFPESEWTLQEAMALWQKTGASSPGHELIDELVVLRMNESERFADHCR